MKIIDVLTSPWAIVPEKLYEIQEIYSTHLRGEKIDLAAIEAKVGKPLENEVKDYDVINNMAVIPIHGVTAKRANMFMRISGGVSTELAGRDITEALNDPDIKGIVLDIDSPGGTVDGTLELANIIFEGRDKKPIVAYSDGIMASAACWIGSAANEIYISGETVQTGSIGVVANHVDYSQYEKKIGIKTTEVYAGKYKRIVSQYKPLSKDGKQELQDRVNYMYSVFVDTIARHRGVSSETVLENMADGKVFIGNQGITAGLVDGVSTLDRLIHTTMPVLHENKQVESKLLILNEEMKNEFRGIQNQIS